MQQVQGDGSNSNSLQHISNVLNQTPAYGAGQLQPVQPVYGGMQPQQQQQMYQAAPAGNIGSTQGQPAQAGAAGQYKYTRTEWQVRLWFGTLSRVCLDLSL